MPLWLDLLRTPMAAPETAALRAMRRTWQLLCVALAASVAAAGLLDRLLGRVTPALIAVLLVTTILYSALYWRRKTRADDASVAGAGISR